LSKLIGTHKGAFSIGPPTLERLGNQTRNNAASTARENKAQFFLMAISHVQKGYDDVQAMLSWRMPGFGSSEME